MLHSTFTTSAYPFHQSYKQNHWSRDLFFPQVSFLNF